MFCQANLTKLFVNVRLASAQSPQVVLCRMAHSKNRHCSIYRPIKKPKVEVKKVLDSDLVSLASKGFHRSTLEYRPPHDVRGQIEDICAELPQLRGTAAGVDRFQLTDPHLRFKLLTRCIKKFNHNITNSQLHTITTVGELVNYFSTPVQTNTPYQDMAYADLPGNVHVQQEYERFHPDTDTRYGGITAFPKSSTIVSGLRYKKKYAGFKAEPPWKDI